MPTTENSPVRSTGDLVLIWVSWGVMLGYLILVAFLLFFGTAGAGAPVAIGLSVAFAAAGFGFNCAAIGVKTSWPSLIAAIGYGVSWIIALFGLMSVFTIVLVPVSFVLSIVAYFHMLTVEFRKANLARDPHNSVYDDQARYEEYLADNDENDHYNDRVS